MNQSVLSTDFAYCFTSCLQLENRLEPVQGLHNIEIVLQNIVSVVWNSTSTYS